MGCAVQEAPPTEQITKTENMPPQQSQKTVVVVVRDKHQRPSQPQPPSATGLKETHSTLLKLLESAPINRNINKETAVTDESGAVKKKVTTDHFKSHHHQHYRKRKESSQLAAEPPLSPTTIPKTEVVEKIPSPPPQQQQQHDDYGAWKKTRLAREWRDKKLKAAANTTNAATTEEEQKSKIDTDDDSMSECEHHRRSSSDSGSSEYGQNDSGCDSDCPDNINELCKNFNEKLSEEDDVGFAPNFHNFFLHSIKILFLKILLKINLKFLKKVLGNPKT